MSSEDSPVFSHQILHRRAPVRWHEGFPLGNGELGVMVWGDGNPLAFTLDQADLWDLRRTGGYLTHPDCHYAGLQRLVAEGRFAEVDEIFEQRELRDNPLGPTKISIGRAELRLGEAVEYESRLELGTATVEGTLRTAAGEHRMQAWVHRNRPVFCLRVTALPPEACLELRPLAEMNDALARLNHPRPQLVEDVDLPIADWQLPIGNCQLSGSGKSEIRNPKSEIGGGGLRILCQSIPGWRFYAVAWNPAGPDFVLAVETAETAAEALAKARMTWLQAAAQGFEALHAEHVEAWREFWAGAAVYLPEPRIEFLWYYGLYLLASSARRGSLPPGLQGLWPMDGVLPPWRGEYAADMNVQETFWPALASGHLDLLDSWCDLMKESIPRVQEFTRRFFGTEGTFWLASTLPRYTLMYGWHTVQFGWSHSGWLGWLVWLRWRYSLDRDWLADTGYPVLAEIFKFYHANLQEEEDGFLHVPLSSSPEYKENQPGAWCRDPNVDLALIRRCCDWVVEMEEALGRAELTPAAREVRGKLAPYALTEAKALCLWPEKPLDEPHRHPSHLMAIHPAMDLTLEDDEESRAIIEASLEQYFSLGQYLWAGHTYAQMASFGAVVGRAEFAYDCLLHFAEYWMGPNGLHFNRDTRHTGTTRYHGPDLQFTMEASCGVSAGISDMLVQGWRDTVRVFPAVPAHWRDVAFRDLLTEGAFRVSAIRRESRTVWVSIRAGVARTLRLRNPFGDAPVAVSGGVLCREGQLFVGELAAGQEVILCIEGETGNFDAAAVAVRRSDTSRLGLR